MNRLPGFFADLNTGNRQLHPDAAPPGQACGGGVIPVPQPSCSYIGEISNFPQIYDYNYNGIGIDNPFVRNKRNRFELEGNLNLQNGLSLQAMAYLSDEYYERQTDTNLANDTFGFERDPTYIDELYGEFRVISPEDRALHYAFGVSFYDYEFLTRIFRSRTNFNSDMANSRLAESANNIGLFANISYSVNEHLILTAEGRLQVDDISGNSIMNNGELLELSQKTTAFLPRLAVSYSPVSNLSLYAQVAWGNNPAGINAGAIEQNVLAASDAFPTIFSSRDIAFFKEEEIHSYEIGIKGTLHDRGNFSINVYRFDWSDYTQPFNLNFEPTDFTDTNNDGVGDLGSIYEGLDFSPGRSFLTAGDVTGYGLELEGSYLITENLNLDLGVSYINISFDGNACSTLPLDFGVQPNTQTPIGLDCVSIAGRKLATQPDFSGYLSFEYEKPLLGNLEAYLRWTTRYLSSQYASEMNLAYQDAYSISDVRLGLRGNRWDSEFYVINLFDDDSPQGIFYDFDGRVLNPAGTPAPPPLSQNITYTTRRDRSFGLRLRYRF